MGGAAGSWTVRRRAHGGWYPDWAERVPDPAPPVTIGWLLWWGGAIAAVQGERVPSRETVPWPGNAFATVAALNTCAETGSAIVRNEKNLKSPPAYPWNDPRPLRFLLAWVNCELMKNVAEIGVLRHLLAASLRSC